MLTDVLNTSCLCKKLVNLIANIEFFARLKVPAGQLLPHPSKHL